MLLREGHGIFAAFGHPGGVDAYYTEVAVENERQEAAAEVARLAALAAAEEERKAEQAIDPRIYDPDLPVFVAGGEETDELGHSEEPWLIVEGTDLNLSWSEFVIGGLRLDAMLRDNVAALRAMSDRYDALTPYLEGRSVGFDDDLSWATHTVARNMGTTTIGFQPDGAVFSRPIAA